MKLRDYQVSAVRSGVKYFKDDSIDYGAIMVLPTGAGKSLVIAGIAKELDTPLLIFQPTREILEQNFGKYIAYGLPASIFSASLNSKRIGQVTFGTIGSVRNKADLFDKYTNIIIDECHLVNAKQGMYKEFIQDNGGSKKVLGLTATPYRLSTDGSGGSILKFLTRTRPRVFKRVIHVTQNETLFERGYLSKLEYKQVEGFDIKQLRPNSTGADYSDTSVRSYYERINFHDRLVNTVRGCLKEGRKNILVFTRFVEESRALIDVIGDQGAIVTGKTPKRDRDYVLTAFKRGNKRIVSNVGVLTLGFDFPELETIIMARPTMSLGLYYQMIGRGIRIHSGKESCWVIDVCDNYGRFGEVEKLKLVEPKTNLWHVENNGIRLTNIYYDDIGKKNEPVHGTDESAKMPFGKHRDKPIDEIAKEDPQYLEWLLTQEWLFEDLKIEIQETVKEQAGEPIG